MVVMLEDRSRYSAENCSVKRTLDVVGEKWTLLILREAFYGARRFEQFRQYVGCPRNVLSDRLETLTREGVLVKAPYQETGRRSREEYRLTDAGRDLLPAVMALMQWGDKWRADPEGPPIDVRHRDCGARVAVSLECDAGHQHLTAHDTEPVPGAGARRVG